jgi:hypothetical protein
VVSNDEEDSPAADEEDSPVKEEEPDDDEEDSPVKEEEPSDDEEDSAAAEEEPSDDEEDSPAAEEDPSDDEDDSPAAEEEPSGDEDDSPAEEEPTPPPSGAAGPCTVWVQRPSRHACVDGQSSSDAHLGHRASQPPDTRTSTARQERRRVMGPPGATRQARCPGPRKPTPTPPGR